MNPDESAPSDPASPPASGAENGGSPADPERLFREHNDALLSYAYARVRSWADAKDVVQEAYVRVFDLGRDRPINHLRAYLYKTVHSCATDWMRRRSVREGFARLECFHVASEATSAEQTWLIRDEIKRALEGLPPKCRQALFLVNIRGLSYEEAAEHMQIKALSVRRLVQRSIEHLYAALDAESQPARSER